MRLKNISWKEVMLDNTNYTNYTFTFVEFFYFCFYALITKLIPRV